MELGRMSRVSRCSPCYLTVRSRHGYLRSSCTSTLITCVLCGRGSADGLFSVSPRPGGCIALMICCMVRHSLCAPLVLRPSALWASELAAAMLSVLSLFKPQRLACTAGVAWAVVCVATRGFMVARSLLSFLGYRLPVRVLRVEAIAGVIVQYRGPCSPSPRRLASPSRRLRTAAYMAICVCFYCGVLPCPTGYCAHRLYALPCLAHDSGMGREVLSVTLLAGARLGNEIPVTVWPANAGEQLIAFALVLAVVVHRVLHRARRVCNMFFCFNVPGR